MDGSQNSHKEGHVHFQFPHICDKGLMCLDCEGNLMLD